VLDVLHESRFVDLAPPEVYATFPDEGHYLCSERTMYRILTANQEVRERRSPSARVELDVRAGIARQRGHVMHTQQFRPAGAERSEVSILAPGRGRRQRPPLTSSPCEAYSSAAT
jgi:hypothetical protein